MYDPDTLFLPYGRQSIDDDDIAAVVAALRSDYLTTGPLVTEFDRAFADAVDAKFGCSCNSGTAALHLAMLAIGVGPEDTVIVPSMTFLASANAARFQGASVVFADVDENTGLLTPDTLTEALGRTDGPVKAIVVVHLNGQSANMERIAEIARTHKAILIEDACHALGAEQISDDGKRSKVGACTFSDFCCFSLHPVKGITTAEGGMVTTNSAEHIERLQRLRSHGMTREVESFRNPSQGCDSSGIAHAWYYEMSELGWNYRLPDVLCALGISQLRKLNGFVERRRELAALYDERLNSLGPHFTAHRRVDWSTHGYHLYAVLIDFKALNTTRDHVMSELRTRGIGTQVHYLPVHLQPYYQANSDPVELPGAEKYYTQCLSLPLFPAMQDQDVNRVIDAIEAVTGAGPN